MTQKLFKHYYYSSYTGISQPEPLGSRGNPIGVPSYDFYLRNSLV